VANGDLAAANLTSLTAALEALADGDLQVEQFAAVDEALSLAITDSVITQEEFSLALQVMPELPASSVEAEQASTAMDDPLAGPDPSSVEFDSSLVASTTDSAAPVDASDDASVGDMVESLINDPSLLSDVPSDSANLDPVPYEPSVGQDVDGMSIAELIQTFAEAEAISEAQLASLQHELTVSDPGDPVADSSAEGPEADPVPTVHDVLAMDAAVIELPPVDDSMDEAYSVDDQPDAVVA
jgi:hypothetical protein